MGPSILKRRVLSEFLVSLLVLGLIVNSSLIAVSQFSKASCSGIVYATSGVPIENALVGASGPNGSGGTLTNSTGAYLINEGLESGNYTVEVIATGYLISNSTGVKVTVGHTTSPVNFFLNPSGVITGKVTDAVSSAALSGVLVYAVPSTGGAFGWSAITNSSGDYTIATDLNTGTYNVTTFNLAGYINGKISGVSVTAGAVTAGENLALARSGIISGRITAYPSGQPLANATIVANYGTNFGTAVSNATGYYRIASGLASGNYTVVATYHYGFNETSDVSVVAGSETPNVNMYIVVTPPPPSGIITGKVTDLDSGKPIVGASVEADGGAAGSGSAITDASGTYVISKGLGTGTYNVTASAKGYNSTTVTGVSVTVSQTTPNVNLQLSQIPPAQSGSIAGTVTGTGAVPEFVAPGIVFATIAAATVALLIIRKKTFKRTQ